MVCHWLLEDDRMLTSSSFEGGLLSVTRWHGPSQGSYDERWRLHELTKELKLCSGKQSLAKRPLGGGGSALTFYLTADQEDVLKMTDDTKKELQKATDPAKLQTVSKVRKVSRACVIVQTTSDDAADRIKQAAPPTLLIAESKSRRPLVALMNEKNGHP
ncbi:hypothetical protein EVAR_68476_1 [Eumeta japonica]|uniref:Uncharacterized protein n=1 Tax=Eumeta variegata TaxID=151549 RepID=A0A4C2A7K4_EUMVA|nr:hypothetical protein EVAR_68476_1 [Eumeta japonica]